MQNYIAPESEEVTQVSLRGTLAQEYSNAIAEGNTMTDALRLVLKSAAGRVSSYVVDDTRIIGYTHERYRFPSEGW